jgi:hypothetical protein
MQNLSLKFWDLFNISTQVNILFLADIYYVLRLFTDVVSKVCGQGLYSKITMICCSSSR